MALMERVGTLLRANLNELLDRTEDPEKMLRQLALDMENQLLQVKTQVAMALADQHLLEKKVREQEEEVATWHRRAGLAVSKGDDALARAALERALDQEKTLGAFRAQAADQTAEVEALRVTYTRLGEKLVETQTRCDLLLAQHRRVRVATRAAGAGDFRLRAMERVEGHAGAMTAQKMAAEALCEPESLQQRMAQMERDDEVERLLAELKSKQRLMPTG